MKSVLPMELESKRIKIAKAHNLFCAYLGALVFGSIFVAIGVIRVTHASPRTTTVALVIAIAVAGLIEAYGIYRIIQHDNELCLQLGYICPFCHKPLYEARART